VFEFIGKYVAIAGGLFETPGAAFRDAVDGDRLAKMAAVLAKKALYLLALKLRPATGNSKRIEEKDDLDAMIGPGCASIEGMESENRVGLAVVEDSEVGLQQAGDRIAPLVGDQDIELDDSLLSTCSGKWSTGRLP
jgi:hypothetical protein